MFLEQYSPPETIFQFFPGAGKGGKGKFKGHKGMSDNPNLAPLGTEGGLRLEREVPNDVVGLIIGPKGANIKKVQHESGCSVEIDKHRGQPGVSQFVVIVGKDQASVDRANQLIEDVVRPVIEARFSQGGGGGGMGGIDLVLEDDYWKNSFPVTMEDVEKIVGPDNATIKRLGAESGSSISIVRLASDGDKTPHDCIIKAASRELVLKVQGGSCRVSF